MQGKTQGARQDRGQSERIAERAICLGDNIISKDAVILYWKLLLQLKSQLKIAAFNTTRHPLGWKE